MSIICIFLPHKNHYKETDKHLSGYDFSKWLNNVHTKEQDLWIKDVSVKL